MVNAQATHLVEICDATWRLQSTLEARNLYQYLLASKDSDELLLIDTGTTGTPRDVVVPALRRLGLSEDALRLVVVTHPDVDHQGGLAAIRERFPRAATACGFADRPMIEEPEKLLRDRYQPYLREHGLGYAPDEERWIRAHYGAPATIDVTLSGGEVLGVGEREVEVLLAPGHSAGHLVLLDRETGCLFTSDAIHWTGCPATDGGMALCPTYEDVDAYLGSIELVERVAPAEMHSGHWPMRSGAEVLAFTRESRAFVEGVDEVLATRLDEPASLAELCDEVQLQMGPWDSEPKMLMFALSGHRRRLLRRGAVEALDPTAMPRRYRAREEPPPVLLHGPEESLGAIG
jgi:glyoxylase-like metal-dependent hydrolase (beta-lactamase superfamily II)